MNNSDEATLRFTLVCAMLCYLATSREPQIEDAPAAAVEATAVVDEFIAAVRAEAVADVRRQIENLHYEIGGQCSVCGDEYDNPQDWPCQTAAIFLVPVATPGNLYCDNGLHSIRAGETCQSDPSPTGEPAIDWEAEAEVWADEDNEPVVACSYNCRLTTLSNYCKCQGQCL